MSYLIDFLSIASLIGIWPRYIEPKMLSVTEHLWHLDTTQMHLKNLTLVHISDLHFHKKTSQNFLNKVIHKISYHNPDLILFTGDFLCYSYLEEKARLKNFLQKLKASLGCYCIFGNHDYNQYVSLNDKGIYDVLSPITPIEGLLQGIKTLFNPKKIQYQCTQNVQSIPLHRELCHLLHETSFQFLENTTVNLPIGLNITGLGDMALGRCKPSEAFKGYNQNYPGIILSHNPDSFPLLIDYPGDWILSGHTHGEQIHFFWPKWLNKISQKLSRLEHPEYSRGLFQIKDKKMYVSRGLGSYKPFRFCSIPEITLIRTK
ncbi:MAG: UDP-2,3-diacylglucosamine diphosphatase LpxG [Chlamydiales bacterium]